MNTKVGKKIIGPYLDPQPSMVFKSITAKPLFLSEVYNHLLASRILCLESRGTFGKRSVVLFLLLSSLSWQSFLREQSLEKKSVELKTF